MNPTDVLEQFQGLLDKLKSVLRWKGNYAPNVQHFPQESIKVDGGILQDEQRVWLGFTFEDNGEQHVVKATFRPGQPGTPGGDDVITFDGNDVEKDDLVIGHREGFEGFSFYVRAVVEFRFTLDGKSYDLRFDGPA